MEQLGKRGLLKTIGVVSILTIVGQFANLGHEVVIAAYFGTSWVTDAYKMALVIPILLTLELTTIINAVTIPTFYKYRKSAGADAVFSSTFSTILLFGLTLTLISFVFAPTIISVVARGFPPETQQLTTQLLRIASPGILLAIASLFLSNILNAYQRFALPSLQRLFLYGSILAAIWIMVPKLGINSAALGYALGFFLFVLALIKAVSAQGLRYRVNASLKHPAVQSMIVLASPLLLFSVLNQFGVLVEKRVVSEFDTGTLSALDFAFKVSVVLINFIVIGINTVLYPTLSESALTEDQAGLRRVFDTLLKALPAIILPISAILICLRTPIIGLIFERGAFDALSTSKTATALLWYSMGLVGIGFVSAIPRFYQALGMNKTLVKVGAAIVVLNLALLLLLSSVLGYVGVALATSISALIHMTVLVSGIRAHIETNFLEVFRSAWRVVVATLGVVVTILLLQSVLDIAPTSVSNRLLNITVSAFSGLIVYLGICTVLRVRIVLDFIEKAHHFVLKTSS